MKRIFAAINTIAALSAGLILLLDYFLKIGFRFFLLEWAVILAGVAVWVGVGNLLSVHFRKIRERKTAPSSLILLIFFIISLLVSTVDQLRPFQAVLMDGIMIPVEISLMAVLSVTLIYACVRLLLIRRDLVSITFVLTILVLMVGMTPWPFLGQLPFVGEQVRYFVSGVLATGGARGILIGIALGTITTGLRILFGVDRPYGGK